MAFPKVAYPCLAASDSTITLVGVQAEGDSYHLQTHNCLVKDAKANRVAFTAATKGSSVTIPPNARMICAIDKTTSTLLYIFNNAVYLESTTPGLGLAQPDTTWDASRAKSPQVVWGIGNGQFKWLGFVSGKWLTLSIDAKGVSTAVPATVPGNIPNAGVYSIIREHSGAFLVIYQENPTSQKVAAVRFKEADAIATEVTLGMADVANVPFGSSANAQDVENDYFFGTSSSAITFTVAAPLNTTTINYISTRSASANDTSSDYVPQLHSYSAAVMYDLHKGFIYGGLVNDATNSWSFNGTTISTHFGNNLSSYSRTPSGTAAESQQAFTITTPPPPPPPVEPSKGLSTAAIIGIAVGAVALIMLVALFAVFKRRDKRIAAKVREQQGLDMAVRDLNSKGGEGMGSYQPRFASTHSLLASEANTPSRAQTSVSTDRPVENLTLRVPIVRYDGRDVAQSVPHAALGAVVLSQYRLGQTAVKTNMVVIQLGENVDTAESVTLKWVRDEIVWQREAAMLNHIVNPSRIISLHQTMIIPAALEWRHILVLDAHDATLDFMLSNHRGRLLQRSDQVAVAKALLSGLVWCHEKDVVHLSICTGSLVLNEEGQWVLWSFGGSRFLNEAVGPRQGSLIGQENGVVERNLAPELLTARRDKRLDTTLSTTAMDAWAAGCVLFEVLTGQPLFRTEEAAEQAATGRFNAWKDRMVDIQDQNERRVVEGLLVLDPNYRLTLSEAHSRLV